jgi:tetratricopeptide (TPR) repeat protein
MSDYHIARPEEKALIDRITKAIAQPEAFPMMFYVWGIGGVGKSTILNKTQEKLEEQYKNKVHFTKFSFGAFTETPLDVMVKLHKDLPPLGLLKKDLLNNSDHFAEKHKTYKETLHALQYQPIDKEETVSKEQIDLAKQIAKLAINVGGWAVSTATTMGINTPLSAITSSMTSTAISGGVDTAVDGAVTALSLKDNLLAKHRATQKAEVQELMLEPLPKLTQAFVETLVNHAKRVPVVLILDTYEKVSPDVDRWLREMLLQNKELKNSKVRILMAGRFQLFKKDGWKELSRESKLVQETPLKIFEKEQTKSYLEKIGVSDKRDIEKLNKLTKGLPFYLDLIRKNKEDGEPINYTEEISERLFKGLTEQQKSLLQLAACCRWFDKHLLQSLVSCRDLDFVTGVDPSLNCFEWLKGYDLVDFVEDSNYRYCLKDVARDVIRQSLHGNNSNEFRNIHAQLQKYFEELADREVPPDLYESEKYENEIWCRYTAEAIYHAFFNLRRDECKQYFLNHFFASRFFAQISVVIAPFTAIAAESEFSENILVYQENRKFLEDIDRVFPFGWFQMNSSPKYEFQFEDTDLPKEVLEKMQKDLKLQAEKSEIVLKEFYGQSNSLSNGLAKWVALMSKSRRCRSDQRLEVLKQTERQANLLENKILPVALGNIFFEVANSYISLKKYEEAIAAYDQALQIKPDDHEAWNNRGSALGNLGRYEEAITACDQALQIKSDKHEAWFNRGIALVNLGRYEEAITACDQVLQIKPDDHEAWNNRGGALVNLGRYEEVITACDQALHLKPDLSEAWNNRSNALFNLGRYEEAIAACDQVLQIKPDDHEVWHNRGNALDELGRYEESLASYDQALQIKPEYALAFKCRGVSLTRIGQYDKALTDFNRAIELEPNDLQSQINRCVLFAWMEKYAEGIELCDGILQNNPNHVDALYGKACCYALQKNIDDSIKYLTLAIAQEADETKKRANRDPEFDGIRDDNRFQELVSC